MHAFLAPKHSLLKASAIITAVIAGGVFLPDATVARTETPTPTKSNLVKSNSAKSNSATPSLTSPYRSVTAYSNLRTEAITLHFEDRSRDSVGPLIYLGGIELKSDDSRFGGLSSLLVSEDGSQMLAVSDRGYWVGASLDYKAGRLVGGHNLMIAPLLDLEGQSLSSSKVNSADAEALAKSPGIGFPGSGFIVSFEGDHRLWHYAIGYTDFVKPQPARPLPLPVDIIKAIEALPDNTGIEALATLPDGSLVAIAEDNDQHSTILQGWIIGETQIAMFKYLSTDNFKPTDLAVLPNGDLLVLERRFALLQGLAARIKRVSREDLKAAARAPLSKPVDGTALATMNFPYNIDNMEGLSVRQGPDGETLVYILSDDNFHPLQRTLLMMFRLEE